MAVRGEEIWREECAGVSTKPHGITDMVSAWIVREGYRSGSDEYDVHRPQRAFRLGASSH